MKTKQCMKCHKWKPLSKFYKKQSWCKECLQEYYQKHKKERQEYDRLYNIKRKDDIHIRNKRVYKEFKILYNNLKINGCAMCGSYNNLEFHHVNPKDKLFNISNGMGRDNEDLSEEINKCILLCKSCHMKIERKEKCV